jgi:flagellar basal body P-ring formation protein FlgA
MKLLSLLIPVLLSWSAIAAESGCEGRLREALTKRLPEASRIQIQNLRVSGACSSKSQVSVLSPDVPLGFVTFEVDSALPSAVRLQGSAQVRAFAPVAVAAAPINHGESFTASNVQLEERELSRLVQFGFFTSIEALAGRTARGSVGRSQVIGKASSQPVFVVAAGEGVTLVKRRGGLLLSAKVRALQAGLKDQWVQVQNPSTGKLLLAKVSGPGEVEVR